MTVIPALLEWHDARKALFDASGTVDATAAQPYWERLAKAEHALMDVARGIKGVVVTSPERK